MTNVLVVLRHVVFHATVLMLNGKLYKSWLQPSVSYSWLASQADPEAVLHVDAGRKGYVYTSLNDTVL